MGEGREERGWQRDVVGGGMCLEEAIKRERSEKKLESKGREREREKLGKERRRRRGGQGKKKKT